MSDKKSMPTRKRELARANKTEKFGLSTGPTKSQTAILGALQTKHVYAGTTDPATVAKRRAANKRARAQRKANARKARG